MITDFQALVEESIQERYDPRARRCRPWSHEWSMWQVEITGRRQIRRCVGCGKMQVRQVSRKCCHVWSTVEQYWVSGPVPNARGYEGVAYMQKCERCGDMRRKQV
jgi:hypothetical protein